MMRRCHLGALLGKSVFTVSSNIQACNVEIKLIAQESNHIASSSSLQGIWRFAPSAAVLLSNITTSSNSSSSGSSNSPNLHHGSHDPEGGGSVSKDDNSSVATRLSKAGDRADLAALLSIVEESGEKFDNALVESALTQIHKCAKRMESKQLEQLHTNSSFQMLADMAVSIASTSPPKVLAKTMAVLGKLNFADQVVLDELARNLMPGVQELDPHEMQQLVEGMCQVDHSPSVLLLDAIHERLQDLGNKVEQQQVDAIMDNLKSLGRDGANPDNPEAQPQPERINYT